MKNLILLSTLFLSLTFSSCKKECSLGYEGKNCKTEIRTQYYGKYMGVAVLNSASYSSQAIIGAGAAGVTHIDIDGLDLVMSSKDNFYIPSQFVTYNGANAQAYGTGYFNGNEYNQYLHITTISGSTVYAYFTGIKVQ